MRKKLETVARNATSALMLLLGIWIFVFLVVVVLGSAFYAAVAILKWIMGI